MCLLSFHVLLVDSNCLLETIWLPQFSNMQQHGSADNPVIVDRLVEGEVDWQLLVWNLHTCLPALIHIIAALCLMTCVLVPSVRSRFPRNWIMFAARVIPKALALQCAVLEQLVSSGLPDKFQTPVEAYVGAETLYGSWVMFVQALLYMMVRQSCNVPCPVYLSAVGVAWLLRQAAYVWTWPRN